MNYETVPRDLKGRFSWRRSQLERWKILSKFNFSLQSMRWFSYVCSAIGKMFTNQSFAENKAAINGEMVQICCSIS